MLAIHHYFAALIDHFASFHHPPVVRAFWFVGLFLDGDAGVNGVADEHRLGKSEPVVTVAEGHRIDLAGGEADACLLYTSRCV